MDDVFARLFGWPSTLREYGENGSAFFPELETQIQRKQNQGEQNTETESDVGPLGQHKTPTTNNIGL